MTRAKAPNGQPTPKPVHKDGKVVAWKIQITLRRPDGSPDRQQKQFPTQKAALEWAAKMTAESNRRGIVKEKSVMVPDVVEAWINADSDKAPTTLDAYRMSLKNHIRPRLKGVRVAVLTEARLNRFLREVADSISRPGAKTGRPATYMAYTVVKGALAWAARPSVGMIQTNPLAGVSFQLDAEGSEHRRHIPEDDARRILMASEGQPSQLVWKMAMMTGLRRGELLGLNVNSLYVDTRGAQLHIKQISSPESGGRVIAARTKGKVKRPVPLTPSLLQDVLTLIEGRAPHDPLFVHPTKGGRLSHAAWKYWWQRDLEAAGLGQMKYVPHQLRHTFATLALAANRPVNVVSSILGHASVGTTWAVYAHTVDRQMFEAADAVESAIAFPVAGTVASESKVQPSIPVVEPEE